jgi:hypothetical protein
MVLLIVFAGSQLFCVHVVTFRKFVLQVVDHAFQLVLAGYLSVDEGGDLI